MKKLVLITVIILSLAGIAYSYSGLIIDATSSIMPQEVAICSPAAGNSGLRNSVLSDDINNIIDKSLICYTPSVDAAKNSGFVGRNPLVVRIISRVDEPQITDIIIPAKEAEEIIRVSKRSDYLGNLKIAIVL